MSILTWNLSIFEFTCICTQNLYFCLFQSWFEDSYIDEDESVEEESSEEVIKKPLSREEKIKRKEARKLRMLERRNKKKNN